MGLKLKNCINTSCPWSGEPVAEDSLDEYMGHVIGFCSPQCRDKFRAARLAFDQCIIEFGNDE